MPEGAHITCSDSSAIYIEGAKNTYILFQDNSANSLTDGSAYNSVAPDSVVTDNNSSFPGGGNIPQCGETTDEAPLWHHLNLAAVFNNIIHTYIENSESVMK